MALRVALVEPGGAQQGSSLPFVIAWQPDTQGPAAGTRIAIAMGFASQPLATAIHEDGTLGAMLLPLGAAQGFLEPTILLVANLLAPATTIGALADVYTPGMTAPATLLGALGVTLQAGTMPAGQDATMNPAFLTELVAAQALHDGVLADVYLDPLGAVGSTALMDALNASMQTGAAPSTALESLAFTGQTERPGATIAGQLGVTENAALPATTAAAPTLAITGATGAAATPSGSIAGTATFTGSGDHTWSAPAGVTTVDVEAWGGGGGGGNAGVTGGGGGGGGAYARTTNIPCTPNNSYTVHVGAGGGTAAAGQDTSLTGDSSNSVVAKGGQPGGTGGPAAQGAGGAGGTAAASTGTTKHNGGTGGGSGGATLNGGGGAGGAGSTNDGGNGASNGTAGAGGATGGGAGGAGASSSAAVAGNSPGGGGGGASTTNSSASGASGKIVLRWTQAL